VSVDRKNFGKSILAARALLGFNRHDLASRASVGHETVARSERGEDQVGINALAAIQRALEEAGAEFPDGTQRASVRLRSEPGFTGVGVVADSTMPCGAKFMEPL